MDSLSLLLEGFASALTPGNLLWALVGVTIGTAVGVLPGIGPALTVALLLPITFRLEPTSALILFAGIYYGGMYGGSTTAILLNVPGESSSMVTALEGNKMARAGRAAAALATAAIGSFVAGTIGTIALTFVAPVGRRLRNELRSARVCGADGRRVRDGERTAWRQPRQGLGEPAHRGHDRFGRHRRADQVSPGSPSGSIPCSTVSMSSSW